ncbi:hypothetical protein [Pyxidicoccus xibeiensis]|uniref:hypothetical protein n=1 Tax=Pyxidicoccus xibeiensis TaxID=2906759 RepID=UPI0020A80CFB|nr:hypothetical protein [Pyxidicoccus xibeiensis]MCP3141530.1 hypothetical protein [Pyxidicoccus xibeiensis]
MKVTHEEDLQQLVEHAVQRLVDDWSSREPERRPWGMWVLRWGPIQDESELDARQPPVPLLAAWFLTDSGFVRRDVWSYLRHRAMVWSSLAGVRLAPVGVLEVAPYLGRSAVYAAAHFGPRDANGFRLERDSRGQPGVHRLWVS